MQCKEILPNLATGICVRIGPLTVWVTMRPAEQHKTAFSMPGLGLFEWIGSPIGLSNTPGAFQRLMQSSLPHRCGVLLSIF